LEQVDFPLLTSYTRRIASPRTFSLPLMPHVDAVLVFDASNAETTGEYDLYSVAPSEQHRLWGEWEAVRTGLTPTGHIPVSDVEFDESIGYRIHTLGIERFATTS
jgi:hypothetical protein